MNLLAKATFAEPSTLFPARLRAVVHFAAEVAVAAFPVQEPEDPLTLPVTLPVRGPANPLAVRIPVEGTNESFVLETFAGRFPVLAVTHRGYIVAAVVVSSAIVSEVAIPPEAAPMSAYAAASSDILRVLEVESK
jgi:hypothetical protein